MILGKQVGVSSESYHEADAIGHSKLEVFRRRPALYRQMFIDRTTPREETRAMVVGQALHCAVLEAPTLEQRFAVRPEGIDRRTNVGKAAWEKFCGEANGKKILDGDEAGMVRRMAKAICEHPTASKLLTGGEAEVTWRARANTLPIPLQCRTDYFNGAGCELSGRRPYVVDLKTVETLDGEEFRNFERAFVSRGYHRQVGFYCPLLTDCGVTCWDFYFVAVEKQQPFGCAVYQPNEDAVARGMEETVRDLERLAQCYRTGDWPNMPEEVQEIRLPEWYVRQQQYA